jgi:MFS family permease
MSLGPLLIAAGTLLLLRVGEEVNYWTDVLPGLVVFGLGLALMVAPLTATVLGSAPEEFAGVASAVNNDVARTAGLIAIAVLPPLAGISNADFGDPAALSDGFRMAMLIAGGTLIAGGALAWATIRRQLQVANACETEPKPTTHCALDAPPLRADCGRGAEAA